ncbi:hypothetical protein AVEN_59180-1 [Araneus ventricosus]|uniref:Uncharacterized protein n=1 Tax=Araneus ventricosus TaxID=182803 RepID=A0A4Y2V1Z5_ARAVE|nr:hypothetical protein AVEN_59180-1 [Araneus ventricosus]
MQVQSLRFPTSASSIFLGEPRTSSPPPYTHVATPAGVDLWLGTPSGAVDIQPSAPQRSNSHRFFSFWCGRIYVEWRAHKCQPRTFF